MSKAKFEAARELIREKRYAEARAILKTINDPKAREWEAKLNNRESAKTDQPKPKSKVRSCLTVILGVIVASLCLMAIPGLTGNQSRNQTLGQVVNKYGGQNATYAQDGRQVRIRFVMSQWDEATAINDAKATMIDLLCGMKVNGFTSLLVILEGTASFTNAFGSESRELAISGKFSPDTIRKLDCNNKYAIRVLDLADDLYLHPALQ